jgi:acyl-CoA synthetase (AMP-forming)/AMP-acid ligase II
MEMIYQCIEANLLHSAGVAVIDGARSYTYADLNRYANQFAHYCRAQGVSSGDEVGFSCVKKSGLLLAALLGVMRLGATYRLIELRDHPEYLSLKDPYVGCSLRFSDQAQGGGILLDETLWLDLPDGAIAFPSDPNTRVTVVPASAVIPDSRWVPLTLGALSAAFHGWQSVYPLYATDVYLQLVPWTSDMMISDWVRVLSAGATMLLVQPDTLNSPADWVGDIQAVGVTVIAALPSMATRLMRYLFQTRQVMGSVRLWMTRFNWQTLSAYKQMQVLAPSARIALLYALTEAAMDVAYCDASEMDLSLFELADVLPMGRFFPHVEPTWRVEDVDQVARSLEGEASGHRLMVCGESVVAGGYLDQPAWSLGRFTEVGGLPSFDTQDYVVPLLDDPLLLWGARANPRVLYAEGGRTEHSEISALLCHYPGIEAACVYHNNNGTHLECTAFVVTHPFLDLEHEAMSAFLAYHMRLAHLNIRCYRVRAIPELGLPASPHYFFEQGSVLDALLPISELPSNEIEQALLAIWSACLEREHIALSDSFADMGGSSALYDELIAAVNNYFKLAVSPSQGLLTIKQFADEVIRQQLLAGENQERDGAGALTHADFKMRNFSLFKTRFNTRSNRMY